MTRLLALLPVLGLSVACGTPPSLVPGKPVTREISVGDLPVYRLSLHAGDFVELTLDQNGENLTLELLDPQRLSILEVDTPNGPFGRERLYAVAEVSGDYRVRVESFGYVGGAYTLRAEVRPASEKDRRRALACRLLYEGWLAGDSSSEADAQVEQALTLWEDLEDSYLASVALLRLGQRYEWRKEDARAIEVLTRARTRIESLETRDLEPVLLISLARSLARVSGFEPAREIYGQALQAAKEQRNLWQEAVARNELALAMYDNRRQFWLALGLFDQALDIFQELREVEQQAIVHLNRGLVFNWLGREGLALEDYAAALDLRERLGSDPRARAVILLEMGWTRMWSGDAEKAEATILEARSLLEEDDRQLQAACSDRLGTLYRREQMLEKAQAAYLSALEGFEEAGDDAGRAHVVSNLGRTKGELGDTEGGLADLAEAGRYFAHKGDRSALAYARAHRARLLRQAGDLPGAQRELKESLALHEKLREETGSSGFRSTYLETVYEHFQLYVDLLMEMETVESGRGWAVDALEAVERSRARSLLELVAEFGAERQRETGRKGGVVDETTASALAEPRTLEEIRRALDPDTALLVYALGETRSFVWRVEHDGLRGWEELDSRDELAGEVRPLVDALGAPPVTGSGAQDIDETLARLGRELLPWASLPTHVVVVPDGALQYLPFAALRVDGRHLIEEHRVSRLPSASVLLTLRDRRQVRPPAPARLAVMADPVLDPADPRLSEEAAATAREHRREEPSELDSLQRLAGSGEEAARLASLVARDCHWEERGFGATHEAARGEGLTQAGLVHFATHALLDDEHPERSQVVLSRFDRSGQARNGSLFAFEIAQMDLAADLVVLSACRTALGREIRGEGLVGLPQSFFEAGADRVAVSLWNVDDTATAELMEHFYDGLLRLGLPPAEALREAQKLLLRSKEFTSPYYWASFTLAGDWRELPSTLRDARCLSP